MIAKIFQYFRLFTKDIPTFRAFLLVGFLYLLLSGCTGYKHIYSEPSSWTQLPDGRSELTALLERHRQQPFDDQATLTFEFSNWWHPLLRPFSTLDGKPNQYLLEKNKHQDRLDFYTLVDTQWHYIALLQSGIYSEDSTLADETLYRDYTHSEAINILTVDFFLTLPFSLHTTDIHAVLPDTIINDTTYERILVSWTTRNPDYPYDEYLLYINTTTGLLAGGEFTVRDRGKRATGAVELIFDEHHNAPILPKVIYGKRKFGGRTIFRKIAIL